MGYEEVIHTLESVLRTDVLVFVIDPRDRTGHVTMLSGTLVYRPDPPGFRRQVGLPPQELEVRQDQAVFSLQGVEDEQREPYCEFVIEHGATATWQHEDDQTFLDIDHGGILLRVYAHAWQP